MRWIFAVFSGENFFTAYTLFLSSHWTQILHFYSNSPQAIFSGDTSSLVGHADLNGPLAVSNLFSLVHTHISVYLAQYILGIGPVQKFKYLT